MTDEYIHPTYGRFRVLRGVGSLTGAPAWLGQYWDEDREEWKEPRRIYATDMAESRRVDRG